MIPRFSTCEGSTKLIGSHSTLLSFFSGPLKRLSVKLIFLKERAHMFLWCFHSNCTPGLLLPELCHYPARSQQNESFHFMFIEGKIPCRLLSEIRSTTCSGYKPNFLCFIVLADLSKHTCTSPTALCDSLLLVRTVNFLFPRTYQLRCHKQFNLSKLLEFSS